MTGEDARNLGLANLVAPLDELDTALSALLDEIRPNSAESIAAYKDLYAVAENKGLVAGLNYEAAMDYEFSDTDERLSQFR